MIVEVIHGNKVEEDKGNLEDTVVIIDSMVDREFREEVYKMCSVLNLRSLGIDSHITGYKT